MSAPTDLPARSIRKSGMNSPRPALQSHVAFFDTDEDGVIWPTDTYSGVRAIGFGVAFSIFAMIAIHSGLSWYTFGTWWQDPFFRIRVNLIHKGKHGSDTGSVTQLGEFDEARFDYVFKLNTDYPHTRMSFREVMHMVNDDRNPRDTFGWSAAALEWLTLYLMLWPADGYMSKQDIHDIFDGSLFYRVSGRPNPRNQEWKLD